MENNQEYVSNITKSDGLKIETEKPNEVSKTALEQVAADWKNLKKTDQESLRKKETLDTDETLFLSPRGSCKHCYGRGFTGVYDNRSKLAGEIKLCSCLSNHIMTGLVSADTKRKRLTYGDFKKMLSYARKVYNLKEPENEFEQSRELPNDSSQGNGKEDGNSADQAGSAVETEGVSRESSS